jgi:hypothetical protein
LLIATSTLLTLSTNIVNADTTTATVASDGTSTAADGKVVDSKSSTVSVTVVSGILTLDAVPDFSFRAVDGAKVGLISNTTDNTNNTAGAATANDGDSDGNNSGLLQVTDSRVSLNNNLAQSAGFTLGARISSLQPFDSSDKAISGFSLTLNPQSLVDDQGNAIGAFTQQIFSKKAVLSDTNNSDTDVIDLAPSEYKPGVVSAIFSQFTDGASLYLPKGSTDASGKSERKYNAVITWTLTPKPQSTIAP